MKYKKFTTVAIIFVSIIIIVTCAYFKSVKEGLTNNNDVILVGDSVLNNSNYVPTGKSVYDVLKTKLSNVNNFAKDGATIHDLYGQLDKIPMELNNSNVYLFISAGGNDILNSRTMLHDTDIMRIFNKYMEFLKALRAKLTNVNINVMNLYMPSNPRYQSYKSSIDKWNELIKLYSNKVGAMYNVIDLHALLKTPNDFVYDIEPSESASVKIAYIIYVGVI
jgi:hypothetical protein